MIRETLQQLTLREKIFQTMIIHNNDIYDEEKLAKKLKNESLGGFFVGEEIIGSQAIKGDAIIEAVMRINKHSKIPPIICADTEFGCGYMFPDGRYSAFPWQMTLGATHNTEYAYEFGKYTAIPAREIGINLSLGPVADLNMNFLNPVANTRTIGDDPELVKQMLVSMIKGMQEYGMGATVKHFPGDGVDYRDQHYVLTSNTLSVEEWRRSFGAVYQALIDEGVLCVMAGHISLPSYQHERIDGIAPPATLSKELITDLLKGELGFRYAVMSDAVCMNAFRTTYCDQVRSELECFKAGVDLLLWPSEEYPLSLERAIETGEIPMSRLDDAVERILRLKEALGLFDDRKFKTDTMEGVMSLDKRIAEDAITLVRDRRNQLPLSQIKRAAVIALTEYEDEIASLRYVIDEFALHGVDATLHRGECREDPSVFDLILYVTFCHQHKPCGMLQITPSWQTGALSREKTAVVAFGSPYLINSNFPTVNMAVAAYSDTEQCQRASVKAILGEIPFKGVLPVKMQSF
mgnify:CR=1 FL=1